MTESDRFWLLVSRKLAHEASQEDIVELESFIQDKPDYQAKYESICTYWQQNTQKNAVDVNAALKKTLHTLDKEFPESNPSRHTTHFFAFPWFKVAAVLTALMIAGIFLYHTPTLKNTEPALLEKRNEKGMRSEILLSDGSSVWLNADSELRYPELFAHDIRKIYLSGEAYFDIAKDTTRPFIIQLDNNQIKVLGTSFNVKAYKEDDTIETTVVSGEVAFIRTGTLASKDQKDTLLLTPNFKALYSKQTGTITKAEVDTRLDIAWKEGKLLFKSTQFADVGKVLERTFGKKVTFSNEAIKQCRITATFQDNSLEEIMILIAKTNDYAYEITENQLAISGEGCE